MQRENAGCAIGGQSDSSSNSSSSSSSNGKKTLGSGVSLPSLMIEKTGAPENREFRS